MRGHCLSKVRSFRTIANKGRAARQGEGGGAVFHAEHGDAEN